MPQRGLSVFARLILLLFALLGVAFYGLVIPVGGFSLLKEYRELQGYTLLWLLFTELMAVPDAAALLYAWKLFGADARVRASSYRNARRFRRVLVLTVVTAAYFFVGSTALLLFCLRQPASYLSSFSLSFFGVAVVAVALLLSGISRRASEW